MDMFMPDHAGVLGPCQFRNHGQMGNLDSGPAELEEHDGRDEPEDMEPGEFVAEETAREDQREGEGDTDGA